MSNGIRIEKRDRGDLWSSFLLCHFQDGQFWFGVREGMLGTCCWLLWLVPVGVGPHSLGSPGWIKVCWGGTFLSHVTPTLAPETLEGVGVLPIWSASLAIFGSLGILSLASSSGGPHATANRGTAGRISLFQTSSAIMGVGASRNVPVYPSSPLASLSGAIWSTARAVALACSGQGSHQLGYLVSKLCSTLNRFSSHCWPSPHLVSGFFVFVLCLVGCNHKLGIGGPRITVEVLYWVSHMFTDPMEEAVSEVLLYHLIHDPSGALQPDFVEGPF